VACMHVLVNSHFAENPSTWSWLTPSFHDEGVTFKIPHFDGKYDPNAYISWELAVKQKFTCFEFHENDRVRVATSEFTNFASVW
jgi:hypothetical protein